MRTITAPGVEIKEIDKSGYSPAMTGSTAYIMGFANKGEAYQPMEFTSRPAWVSYYGEPDNEAERYFYNACVEVLNQNGRLYCARLPYDNASFEKIVGYKYTVNANKQELTKLGFHTYDEISAADSSIKDVALITPSQMPQLFDLSSIDAYRTDEEKVATNSFIIVDKTCAPYKKVVEDSRKGKDREVLGIVPVVTTAAQALYTQSLINVGAKNVKYYETIGTCKTQLEGNDGLSDYTLDTNTNGLLTKNPDLIVPFNTIHKSYQTIITSLTTDIFTVSDIYSCFNTIAAMEKKNTQLLSVENYNDVVTNYDNLNGYSIKDLYLTAYGEILKKLSVSMAEKFDNLTNIYGLETAKSLSTTTTKLVTDFENSKIGEYTLVKQISSYEGLTITDDLTENNDFYYTFDSEEYSSATYSSATFTNIKVSILKRNLVTQETKYSLTAYVRKKRTSDGVLEEAELYEDTTGNAYNQIFKLETIDKSENYKIVESVVAGSTTTTSDADERDNLLIEGYTLSSNTTTGVDIELGTFAENLKTLYSIFSTVAVDHSPDGDDTVPTTVSLEAASFFPTIQFNTELNQFERENLKKIGVVVYRTYIDPGNGNKVAFEAVEAFAGSLNKNDKDPNTGVTTFIDTIINSQSNYINFFSNCFARKSDKKVYEDLDIYIIKPCDNCASLGFFTEQTEETISIDKSILDGMNKCFEKVSDINERDIDIIPDAGISNIAAYLKAIYGNIGQYDLMVCDEETGNSLLGMWKADDNNASMKIWRTVIQKLDNFCKNVRKDCMFIADGPRPMVLQGQKKIVRPSKPTNNIDVNILPYLKFITGLNTSYGAGYLDWFEIADEYTGDFFWLPPSIKAMGSYIFTDVNFHYWDAPAGLTRGLIPALDCAFSPNGKQAGAIYEKNWNYAINYPNDGIVLEGQKTFQVKPSAFDRVNVRRLFLRLERQAFKVARYFVYEGNTAYTRTRLKDALDPYFKEAKIGGGIYDYKIVCDESNNTPTSIDRNELHVSIGIKPVKTAEFILIDFIAVSTGGSFEEAMA